MKNRFPTYGWLGFFLAIVFWALNWGLDGLRTNWAFFPMWLGYILTMDALVDLRKPNESIFKKSKKTFVVLFLVSAPFWWLFELIDLRTEYWVYLGRDQFSDLEYFLFATLSFSTVIPAVFETADFLSTFSWAKGFEKMGKWKINPVWFFGLGLVLLAFTLWKPEYSSAFLWMSLFFLFDSVNYWLKNPSIIHKVGNGNWKTVFCLCAGCLICGFFWEMWNFYSYPKWVYDVPFVDFWYVFEMPLLGYLGYIPFALEVYALYHLVASAIVLPRLSNIE